MKKFNGYEMTGITEADNKAILEAMEKEIEMFVDDCNRVWTSGDVYIADCREVEAGEGILC